MERKCYQYLNKIIFVYKKSFEDEGIKKLAAYHLVKICTYLIGLLGI